MLTKNAYFDTPSSVKERTERSGSSNLMKITQITEK